MAPRKRLPAERFWEKVDKTDGCWLWTAAKNAAGYGVFAPGTPGKSTTSAHRFAWELANGPVPKGKWVLHKCDNPPCVRADHLFLGTAVENSRDMFSKGRQPPGRKQRGPGKPASLILRMTPEFHKELKTGAAEEGVSLNAWIISLLAGASGFKNTEEE